MTRDLKRLNYLQFIKFDALKIDCFENFYHFKSLKRLDKFEIFNNYFVLLLFIFYSFSKLKRYYLILIQKQK